MNLFLFFWFFYILDEISDEDGKRETEKSIVREQLLASWLRRKQLEEEVINDMMLHWRKNCMPSINLEATSESCSKPLNGINILLNLSLLKSSDS